jgi:hypothetical protein
MVESMRAASVRLVLPSSIRRLWGDLQASPRGEAYKRPQQYPPIERGRKPATPWTRRYPHRTLTLATSAATTYCDGWLGAGSINELRSGDG